MADENNELPVDEKERLTASDNMMESQAPDNAKPSEDGMEEVIIRDTDEKPQDHPASKKEELRIMKNVLVVSLGFLFIFTAFQSLQNLQSSLNPDQGLGLASLSVVYAALILSCILVPPYMIGRLGCKWTLVISMFAYVLYTVANYYARWGTMIPASILLGASAAPLWASKCTYLSTSGIRLAEITGQAQEAIVTRFFGIFFLIFQSGQIWGNLISSLVLGQKGPDIFREDANEVCGVNFCGDPPKDLNMTVNVTDTLALPEYSLVITLLSIYVGCGVMAVLLIVVFLDRLTGDMSRKKESVTGVTLLVATLKHLKDRRMQLVLPITVFSGLEQAFIFGDFTKAFVTCSLGIHKVGFIMICFGVTDAAFSYILGRLTQYTGRLAVFVSGLVVHLTVLIIMLAWTPDASLVWIFYVLAALQGYGDAVWQTQINAMYGVYFADNQEPAFSNYRLWESLGFLVAFAYSNALCIRVKLVILIIALVLGFSLYLFSEMVHRKQVQQRDLPTEEKELKGLKPTEKLLAAE
ncbi:protein unc-93 homolog A [Nematostella vectensis]|uniref:protein unc-93 homolog A n=1 Tax=Nematostella vectensis TaxID=45351 RepID=UPI0020774F61|nr:protein unc-93 homolog A [Nematostella vectensis]XP_032236002.2 protein unc-93 homolog A [Nematostella vectensis]XP_032236003.2 protein unc-93 homolog A [Nematostella vectensis]XP_048581900.1 protein unc-93 homolog A [Nematostella vectensis]XP_048581901.1 protein unc-93 homolog A [Nematostella vectensis]XP_048581902.1 protein unc-93 homolog A [Nematostella vectensis]